jgi:DNA-directed RNA polymerase specialized sigma24 family protein
VVPDFDDFVREVEPRLRRALVGCRGVEGAQEATAEALAYAWEHRGRVLAMENPAGYLYRVGQSRTKARRRPTLPAPEDLRLPDVEPALIPALLALPEQQRTAVWLVHACTWTYAEAAEAMAISRSAIGTHVSRALDALRAALEVDSHA